MRQRHSREKRQKPSRSGPAVQQWPAKKREPQKPLVDEDPLDSIRPLEIRFELDGGQ